MSSESDNEVESEEEEQTALYPLEDKYIDEADKHRCEVLDYNKAHFYSSSLYRLMQLPEIEREKILGERMEEHQRIVDKRNLDQMLKDQTKGGDSDNVSKAAKRLLFWVLASLMMSDVSSLCRSTYCPRRHKGEVTQTRRAQG